MQPLPSRFDWKHDAMNESEGFVVYFFPQALEALGDAIKPYLREGPGGEHVLCHEVDTAGSLIEMTIEALAADGHSISLELMVPQAMVKMIVSARSEAGFGFSPRVAPALMASLPPVAGDAPPPEAASHAIPSSGNAPVTAPSVQVTPQPKPKAKVDSQSATKAESKLPPEG
jgi:hypothetical protein